MSQEEGIEASLEFFVGYRSAEVLGGFQRYGYSVLDWYDGILIAGLEHSKILEIGHVSTLLAARLIRK